MALRSLVIILVLTWTQTLCAQQDEAPEPTPESSEPEASAAPSSEEMDEAARVREAINENLVPDLPSDDPEPGDEPDTEAALLETDVQSRIPDPPPESEQDEPPREPDEVFWYERFSQVADRLQKLPERIPGLAGHGWLHFGRIEFEGARFSKGALEDDSGFNFRSLRGGLLRQVNDRLLVKLEIDLTDGDSNFTDLYGRYNTKIGLFTVGNQKIAQTLVNQTSRLSRTFMEEPLPADAFGLGRRLGVGWDLKLKQVGAHLTAFGPDLNDNIGKFGYGIRAHANPTLDNFNMIHLGASAVQERMDRDAQFRAWPESRVADTRLVDTGRVEDVEEQSIFGLELAAARKSMSFRSEIFRTRWDLRSSEDVKFEGYYLQVNKALTGESFQYAQGKFLRLKPDNPRGAWEVGLRYSSVDLRDRDIDGGRQTNTTFALNWYAPGQQLRIMSHISYVDATRPGGGRETPLVFQVRAQLHW